VILGGRIYRGAAGEHPELGHVVVDPAGPECYCGARGCLESLASGTAIAAAGVSLGLADAREVFAAAARGGRDAGEAVGRARVAVGLAAWTFCHTFLPERLVLGGGIMEDHFESFAESIRERLAGATQFTPALVTVVRAELGNDAGIAGAGALMWAGIDKGGSQD
jgi:glucokinase